MSAYALRRVLGAVPLLLAISALIFTLLQMAPGGPLAVGEGVNASPAALEALERQRRQLGLNDPAAVQFGRWLSGLLAGHWGTSFNSGQDVLALIGERLPATLLLTSLALTCTLVLTFAIGVTAAVRKRSLFDYATTGLAVMGISLPSFWLALMLIFVFSFSLGWLPSNGLSDAREDLTGWAGLVDRARHLILPVTVLTLATTAALTRFMRGAMLETLEQDYVRTARAKGLAERVVVNKHALRNALVQVVTVLALELPALFLGSVIVETVFAISGMGRLFIDSANLRDYPVLMGILTVASVLVIVSNLIADLLYAWLDPRISYR